ncbi:hypothetical protein J6Z19_05205 [bacterium]|nr:hypothetical protein [bacterium]
MKKIFIFILLVVSIFLLACIAFNLRKISSLNEEIYNLKNEKVMLLAEHEKCLLYKEKSLKKELIAKYLDAMMALADKTEQGYKPTEEETATFYERADFIVENINSIEVSQEEAKLIISFVDSAKKILDLTVSKN